MTTITFILIILTLISISIFFTNVFEIIFRNEYYSNKRIMGFFFSSMILLFLTGYRLSLMKPYSYQVKETTHTKLKENHLCHDKGCPLNK